MEILSYIQVPFRFIAPAERDRWTALVGVGASSSGKVDFNAASEMEREKLRLGL